jgi:hypothetical protein
MRKELFRKEENLGTGQRMETRRSKKGTLQVREGNPAG